MSDFNPYAPSQVQHQHTPAPNGESVEISPAAMEALKKTRPWLQTTGILLFVLAGLQIIKVILTSSSLDGLVSPGYKFGLFIGTAIVVLFYILLGAKLLDYKKAISRLSYSNNPADFESAMDLHSSYWKFISILLIVVISLAFLVGFLGALA